MLPDAGALKIGRINTNHDTMDFVFVFYFFVRIGSLKTILDKKRIPRTNHVFNGFGAALSSTNMYGRHAQCGPISTSSSMTHLIWNLVETYMNPEQARSRIRIIAFSKRAHARNRTGHTWMRPTLRNRRVQQVVREVN